MLTFLENLELGGEDTDLTRTAQEFVRRKQRTGLAIVISDLFAPSGFDTGLDLLRHFRYEPQVIQLHDPREERPDFLGDIELYDVENSSSRKVTVTERNLRAYRRLFDEHQQAVRHYCRSYSMGCTQATTEVPFDDLVLRMMRTAGGIE